MPKILISCILILIWFKIFLNSLEISSLTPVWFRNVLFNLWVLGDFLAIFLLLISGLIPLWYESRAGCSIFQCAIYLPYLSNLEHLKHSFYHFTSIFSLVSYSRGSNSWFQVLPFNHSSVVAFYSSRFFEWLVT